MRLDDFVTVFRDDAVRVELDWDAVLAEGSRGEVGVSGTYSRSRRLLGALYTVWYEGADGADADVRQAAARPLRVAETGRTERSWPAERTRRVTRFEQAFRAAAEPVRLVLPAYAVGGGLLLLDGTHRSVAAHRAGVPVRLLVYALHGPSRAELLPDLRHHATVGSPPAGSAPGSGAG
ncbi:hypothetical protein ACTWP5_10505 [Streptomyces sp. 4N509B]|uniref:hypothetical protein n=1 Tax=Streptomyces sp. 4N509B TaxID=3457413 RepID=UPI003FD0029C